MTYYEKIQQDKVFCASLISEAMNCCDYEDDDYDPVYMDMLNSEYPARGTMKSKEDL